MHLGIANRYYFVCFLYIYATIQVAGQSRATVVLE